jgi:hypothetical protein
MSCSLDMLSEEEEEEEGKKDVRGARHIKAYFWSIVVCPLTLQSFLLSPKTYGNSFHGVGLFLRCTLWQSMVLLASKIQRVFSRWRLLSYQNYYW